MLSFYDIDRALDDALADYGAPDDFKNWIKCNRLYRVGLILEILKTAAEMREQSEQPGEQARQAFKVFMDDFKERNT